MPRMKIKQTPDFIRGLLKSADLVSREMEDGEFHPRESLTKQNEIARCPPERIIEFGMYQGRVVLVALAAELALKWLWELENGKPAANKHSLHGWFVELSPQRQQAIREEYQRRTDAPPKGWESVDSVFNQCDRAFEHWRYIVEKDSFPTYVMQATHLKHATSSVLGVAGTLT